MWLKRILLANAAVVFIGVAFMLTGYAFQLKDSFAAYRPTTPGPLAIKPALLKHFGEQEKLAREKLALDLSQRERSIIAGLHWLITYADDDKAFKGMFADFMLLMNALAHSEDRHHQREVVQSIARASLARTARNYAAIFGKDEGDRWRFIEILPSFILYPEFKQGYFDFYRSNFGPVDFTYYKSEDSQFSEALAKNDHKTIFDFLVQTSFLHHFLTRHPTVDIELPPNDFAKFLKRYEKNNYVKDFPVISQDFRTQGYLATHIPLVITNYGELPLDQSINRQKAEKYIEETIDAVQNQLGDFDLYAEYVQCIKMHKNSTQSRIADLEGIIFSLQRTNGSWGSERDFATTSYTAIHPTGSALMALNQSNIVD